MKRKTIIFSILLILVCAIFFFIKQHDRIENRVLKNVTFHDNLLNLTNILYLKYKIPIVIEGFKYPSTAHASEKITYSTKETTVRQLLDTVVPKKHFIWTTDGKFIHIISRALISKSDYQLNSLIEHFFAEDVDRNTLIKAALTKVKKRNYPEQLKFAETPYEEFDIKVNLPKISINLEHVTLREILDQISQKAGVSYCILRVKNSDGSYVQILMLLEHLPIGLTQFKNR